MYKNFLKRLIDVILSVLALIVLSWLYLIIAIIIKATSKGPVLFKQERIGKDGKVFKILKFRSMKVGAEKTGSGVYSGKGDPRVTKVGKFIRATSIDELPQLINILKGDMALIGPRPPLTYHPWKWEEYTDEQRRMFEVRPGITGWAQTHGRKHVEWNERIKLNVWYGDFPDFSDKKEFNEYMKKRGQFRSKCKREAKRIVEELASQTNQSENIILRRLYSIAVDKMDDARELYPLLMPTLKRQ